MMKQLISKHLLLDAICNKQIIMKNFYQKIKKNPIKNPQGEKGFALVITFIVLLLLLLLGTFFIGFEITEFKIAVSQKGGTRAFFLAESGIEEAIYKVKNNSTYQNKFEQGTLDASSGTFSRNPVFSEEESYTVGIISIAPGEAEVTSYGYFETGKGTSSRKVKVKIIKGLNTNPNWDKAVYASNDIDLFATNIDIIGNIYAKRDIDIWGFSDIDVTGNADAYNKIDESFFSTFNVTGEKHDSESYPPQPDEIEMPQIDFDSDNPNSFLSQAEENETVYTKNEFKNLLKNNSPVTLDGIVYVKGEVDIKKNQSLTINGMLVADGDIKVGMTSLFPIFGDSFLTINTPADSGPSGILTKGKIKIGIHAKDTNISGLAYACDEFRLFNFSSNMNLTGGIIAREVNILTAWQTPNIIFDEDRINTILIQEASESPTIEVDHWEEEY